MDGEESENIQKVDEGEIEANVNEKSAENKEVEVEGKSSNSENTDGETLGEQQIQTDATPAETHNQSTSPLVAENEQDALETSRTNEQEEVAEREESENIAIHVDVKKSEPNSPAEQRASSKTDVEEGDTNAVRNGTGTNEEQFNESAMSIQFNNDLSEDQLNLDAAKLPSDLSFSSLDNTTNKGGSWRTLTVKSVTDGEETESTIQILTENFKKPFLGGFRHRLTNVEYHNASCQTYPKRRVPSQTERFHRDTQTVKNKNQFQQTFENTSTQMTKPGCYVSNVTDKVVIPGNYETAEEKFARRLEKVIILQCHWRRWLAERYVNKLRVDREMRIEWERQEEIRKSKERENRLKKEFERRMNPKSKEDFDLLYAALERWRREEIEKINEVHSGPERKAALVGLLEQESYLIASIERHRIKANNENKEKGIKQFLDKAASPKKWKTYDGTMMEVDTPYTLRAQELRDLYNSLQMKYLTQEERLDVLLTLKHTVKEHECKLTHEISELIDRETELLMRGVKESNLEGLRQRISTLYIQFCKIPLFNPEAARLLKVPQDPSTLRKNVYFCPSCTSYLPSSDFPLASNSKIVGRCRRCAKLDNDARLRQDFSKFSEMLLTLRRQEEEYNDGSKIAFIIQDADLRYLVENIWNGQSSLSACEDLHDLVMVRWNKHEHWSPWNCVLLTKEEATSHAKLENVNEAYGRIFIGKVHHRHVIAQKHFEKLTSIVKKMRTHADGEKMKAHSRKITA
eukprot:gene7339-8159_t